MSQPPRRLHGDDGMALFAAVAVATLTSALAMVILGYAVSASRDSARDRGRSVAVASVEGVVDATYAALQTSSPSNLPCSLSPSGVLAVGPDGAGSAATVRYLKADGTPFVAAAGACLPAGYAPTDVAGAVISVTGQTAARAGVQAGKRRMESYVKLTPVFAQNNSLGKAIYASGSVSFTNNSTLLGNNGNDADVYAGTSFVCSNSMDLGGSLYVQGSTTFANTCSVKGDLHSLSSVAVNNQSTIGGRVISSAGNVGLNHAQISVGGVVQAAGTITGSGTWGSCGAPKCQKHLSPAPPPPPTETFPILLWDTDTAAAWAAAGYTNVVTVNDCSDHGGVNGATKYWLDNAATQPAKTVLLTNCAIRLAGGHGKDLALRSDWLLVARGGFSTANQTEFSSTVAGQTRHLHWVVPYDVAARPCSAPQITTDQQFGLTNDVRMFLYSPCDIDFANQSTQIGQVYGGSNVKISNKFTLQFRPVPVFGLKLPPSTVDVESYKVDIVYKRETG